MNDQKRIAIDAMGGEGGVAVTIPAAARALELFPDLIVSLVGNSDLMRDHVADVPARLRERLLITHTTDTIRDEDDPGKVLRKATQSSMYQAINMVKQGDVQAMISAGNTGALLMISRHLLKTIEGIDKPALMATIPGATRQSYLLDVGANPECDCRQLFEFAVMGSVTAESLLGESPKIGLLNIGAETYKGTDEVRQAAALIKACPDLNYIGFVEANDVFSGAADVVVCDGFVGNVTIKTSAGVANVIEGVLMQQIRHNWLFRLAGLSSSKTVARMTRQIDPNRFNGASLLGLQGCIVKSHGNATVEAFTYAIQQTVREVENAVPQLIAKKVAAIMAASSDRH